MLIPSSIVTPSMASTSATKIIKSVVSSVSINNRIQSVFEFTSKKNAVCLFLVYWVGSNILYLSRRAHIRRESIGTMWRYRTQREPGVSIPLYFTFLLVWQCFVLVWPFVESALVLILKRCSLFYSYPNAKGFGFIAEPLTLQHLPLSKRTKQQFRMDWHQFTINIGPIGRDGFRHPPSVRLNRPHIDAPQLGMKHWPWRRQHPPPLQQSKKKTKQIIKNQYEKFTA